MRTPTTVAAALALSGIAVGARAQAPVSGKEPPRNVVECRVFHIADMKHQATSLNVLTAPRLTVSEGKPADVRIAEGAALNDSATNAARSCECGFALSAKVEKLKPRKLVKLDAQVEVTTKGKAGKGSLSEDAPVARTWNAVCPSVAP